MKKISIIGSTGSIGVNTLRVVKAHCEKLKVVALAAKSSAELLWEQAKYFKPELVCLYDDQKASWLERKLKGKRIRLVTGEAGLIEASIFPRAEQVIFATVGAVGLKPIFAAIQKGKTVAVANKEPLVMAGSLLKSEAKRSGASVIPIDSEHSGLWQCLEGRKKNTIKKLVLTSSGGPFFQKQIDLKNVTRAEALRHPRWRMGPKITIDSATLMNKGLEVIEAKNLFEISEDKIEVLIHPESVIHGLVEFIDGSQIAQLGITDMRLPIQYALSYPERFYNSLPTLNLTAVQKFHFYSPDRKRFPCLEIGYEAARVGGTLPAVVNAANEVAVDAFLKGNIQFTKIPKIIERVMSTYRQQPSNQLEQVLAADTWARERACAYV